MSPVISPFGTWSSPWSAERIVAATRGLGEPRVDGERLYWLESRPAEGGRQVVMTLAGDQRRELLPAPHNARSRVHEYGGGSYTVADGVVYFSHYPDQGIYRAEHGRVAPLLVVDGLRFADYRVDGRRRRLLAVCEDHRGGGEPVNRLVAVALDGSDAEPRVLASGADFYAAPALSPDGRWLAWLQWRHPWMPWDGTELWLAELDDAGLPTAPRRLAGSAEESLCEPRWSPDGVLHVVCDRGGWWNLYRLWDGQLQALCPREAEFASPHWQFDQRSYDFTADGTLVCRYTRHGLWHLARLDGIGHLHEIALPYTDLGGVTALGTEVVLMAGSPTEAPALIRVEPGRGGYTVVEHSGGLAVDPTCISEPRPVYFPTGDDQQAHAFFYSPRNGDFQAPPGERPPVLVKLHGGPTAATGSVLNPGIQFWTSRGFALLDVNYGGSTGFGRAYHQRLDGQWGVVDVADCINAVRHAAAEGWVDAGRSAIRGGSAGGYTVLAALAFPNVFRAGASHYGISDLETLAQDTHKFESRYLERLIGPYPQARERYRARSPIHHPEGLSAPVIFFQGLEDRVVPPDQAETMVAALRAKGLPVAYVPFPGEQHGFRQAANIRRSLEAELYFYGRIFGFEPADRVVPVPIDNLPD